MDDGLTTTYEGFAHIYDAIYAAQGKDYEKEACRIHAIIQQHKRCPGNALLDVACGTGGHLQYLVRFYTVEGVDKSPHMLAIARRKLPHVRFHEADMREFHLDRRFDAVICMFGSIGYVQSARGLEQAVERMAAHLHPGGVLIVEPWIYPENFRDGGTHAVLVDEPERKVVRVSVARRKGECSDIEFHFLVATSEGIRHFTERHVMGLFPQEAYIRAFESNGLQLAEEIDWLRGDLFVGVKPI